MNLEFSGEMWFWKGPAPYHFISVPEDDCGAIESVAAMVTYGWGMIPAAVQINNTDWTTALWPKDGGYIVPIKAWVQKAEGLAVGDVATVRLTIDV